ncbi:MAG: substrate-binding periplasmic protein [Bdellovibrio sp.]
MKTLVILILTLTASMGWSLTPLKVAFSLEKSPYVIRSTGSGLEVEILRLIFADMGYDVVPAFQPPARSVRSLELGRVDAMATITNMPKFHLSKPYITFRNFAWTLKHKGIQLKTMSDLSKYRIIAFQNARYFLGSDYEKAADKSPNYQEYSDQNRQLKMLLSNRVDIIICEERVLAENKKILSEESKTLTPQLDKHVLFQESNYSVAFKNVKLRDAFNGSLEKLESHKAFDKIYKKYSSE